MSAKLSEIFKTGATAPKAILLPDSCFFVRSIDVSGASDATAVEVSVDLALEGLSPFPVTQLLHGFHWVPGAPNALVFAAYRRRFSSDEVDGWSGADWVAPGFCSFLSMAQSDSVVLYSQAESITAIRWGTSPVPEQVVCRPVPSNCPPADLQVIKSELIKLVGDGLPMTEFSASPVVMPSGEEGALVFQAGDRRLEIPTEACANHDIRPEETLQQLRKSRRNDLVLWRVACGLVITLAVLLVGELTLLGLGFWQKARLAKVGAQQPVVSRIEGSQALAFRIDELATRRLLPFEMITILSEKRPRSIQFVRTTASSNGAGIHTMNIEAQTSNPDDLSTYQASLRANPAIASVEVSDQQLSNRSTRFKLHVTFKPELLKPANS